MPKITIIKPCKYHISIPQFLHTTSTFIHQWRFCWNYPHFPVLLLFMLPFCELLAYRQICFLPYTKDIGGKIVTCITANKCLRLNVGNWNRSFLYYKKLSYTDSYFYFIVRLQLILLESLWAVETHWKS